MNYAQLHWSIFVNIFNSVVLTFILRRSKIETQKGGTEMSEEEKGALERRRKEWEKIARQSKNISWVLLGLSVLNLLLVIVRIILRIIL